MRRIQIHRLEYEKDRRSRISANTVVCNAGKDVDLYACWSKADEHKKEDTNNPEDKEENKKEDKEEDKNEEDKNDNNKDDEKRR